VLIRRRSHVPGVGSRPILLDQPGTCGAQCCVGSHGGISKNDGPSSQPSPVSGEMSLQMFASPPPPPIHTGSNGSKLSEYFPSLKRAAISLQWIKKVGGKTSQL